MGGRELRVDNSAAQFPFVDCGNAGRCAKQTKQVDECFSFASFASFASCASCASRLDRYFCGQRQEGPDGICALGLDWSEESRYGKVDEKGPKCSEMLVITLSQTLPFSIFC